MPTCEMFQRSNAPTPHGPFFGLEISPFLPRPAGTACARCEGGKSLQPYHSALALAPSTRLIAPMIFVNCFCFDPAQASGEILIPPTFTTCISLQAKGRGKMQKRESWPAFKGLTTRSIQLNCTHFQPLLNNHSFVSVFFFFFSSSPPCSTQSATKLKPFNDPQQSGRMSQNGKVVSKARLAGIPAFPTPKQQRLVIHS